jgi:hypothetical protein
VKKNDFHFANDVTKPALGSKTVVPSDTSGAEIYAGEYARSLMVFSAGTVCFTGVDGADDTWTFGASMPYPQMIPVAVVNVKAAGTSVSAGDIKALR